MSNRDNYGFVWVIWIMGISGVYFAYHGEVSNGTHPLVALFLSGFFLIIIFGVSLFWWMDETARIQRQTLGRETT